jgi:hypothetical protein
MRISLPNQFVFTLRNSLQHPLCNIGELAGLVSLHVLLSMLLVCHGDNIVVNRSGNIIWWSIVMVTLCCNISQHRASNFGAADLSKDSKKIRAPDILVLTTRYILFLGLVWQSKAGAEGHLQNSFLTRETWSLLLVWQTHLLGWHNLHSWL